MKINWGKVIWLVENVFDDDVNQSEASFATIMTNLFLRKY
jgi:hypothetical protein